MELTEPQRTPGLSLILPSSVLSLINMEICCPDPLIFSDLTVSCWLLPLPVCLVPGRQLFSRPVQPVVLLPVSTAPLLARRDSLLDRGTAKGRERSQKAAENVQSARESTRSGTAGQRLDLRTKETCFVLCLKSAWLSCGSLPKAAKSARVTGRCSGHQLSLGSERTPRGQALGGW